MPAMLKIRRYVLKSLLYLVIFLAVYSLVMFVLSRIPVNATDGDPARDVAIYIKSNGVHTDLVLPIRTPYKNWAPQIHPAKSAGGDLGFQYAAFGWGDRDFYLNTPRWSDLKISTAFNAAFFMGSGVMHVTFHEELVENQRCKKIWVSKAEYARIVKFIESTFSLGKTGYLLIPGESYGDRDLFFEADGKYNLFYTCNSWANNGLKAGGQKAALWTLTDTGIFCHY